MKKIAMFFTAVLLLTTDLMAQPYIQTRALKDSYFPYVWINPEDETIIAFEYSALYGTDALNAVVLRAKYFYTEEEIPVYGIAAGLCSITDFEWDHYPTNTIIFDTSWDNAFEYFTLFKPAVDTVMMTPISDSLVFHLRDIAYYMDFGPGLNPNYPTMIIPVYEQYFDSVYYVTDSFYVGWTRRSAKAQYLDTATNTRYLYSSWPVKLMNFAQNPDLMTGDRLFTLFDFSGAPAEWRDLPIDYGPGYDYSPHGNDWGPIYFVFPIIAPPDTTGTGDDSLAVQQVQLVDRLVAVQPNPATERVKVVSSCGMERLTAYDAAGKQVYRQEASGLQATLDVSRWPAGTYILHIQTPMGVSTKRLVVAR